MNKIVSFTFSDKNMHRIYSFLSENGEPSIEFNGTTYFSNEALYEGLKTFHSDFLEKLKMSSKYFCGTCQSKRDKSSFSKKQLKKKDLSFFRKVCKPCRENITSALSNTKELIALFDDANKDQLNLEHLETLKILFREQSNILESDIRSKIDDHSVLKRFEKICKELNL
tara:strand:- start:313 stop:819 length:507 start_codon:yes stop_codon:yes gene_type:complete